MEPYVSEEQKIHLLEKTQMQKAVSHPCVVKLYTGASDERYVYHIMEYLPGGDLFEMVCTVGALPEKLTRKYTSQLILAVEHLHSKHILHNDIKLENLLLDNVDRVKLTDFGLATYEYDPKKARTINGTPEYIAPEIILDKSSTRASDWWSVGVCIFEMLTGFLPFDMKDSDPTHVTFQKILQSTLVIPDVITPLAADLLLRLLQVDNSKRLGSGLQGAADIMKHPWFSEINWGTIANEQSSLTVNFVRSLDEMQI